MLVEEFDHAKRTNVTASRIPRMVTGMRYRPVAARGEGARRASARGVKDQRRIREGSDFLFEGAWNDARRTAPMNPCVSWRVTARRRMLEKLVRKFMDAARDAAKNARESRVSQVSAFRRGRPFIFTPGTAGIVRESASTQLGPKRCDHRTMFPRNVLQTPGGNARSRALRHVRRRSSSIMGGESGGASGRSCSSRRHMTRNSVGTAEGAEDPTLRARRRPGTRARPRAASPAIDCRGILEGEDGERSTSPRSRSIPTQSRGRSKQRWRLPFPGAITRASPKGITSSTGDGERNETRQSRQALRMTSPLGHEGGYGIGADDGSSFHGPAAGVKPNGVNWSA